MNNIIGKKSWRDSASLIVLRKRNNKVLSQNPGGVNYNILLQTRTRNASFPNSVVFPGGVSEPADGSQRWLQYLTSFGYTKQDFEAFHRPSSVITPLFQKDPIQRHVQLRITAIRETFEELGLLLCSREHKDKRINKFANVINDFDVKFWQEQISKDPESLLSLCEEQKCYPDIWSLNYWSNWLTPTHIKKRFDTAFFVTALDDKPVDIKGNSEVVDVEWLDPEKILESDRIFAPPQVYELKRLSHVKDLDQLIQFAKERSGYDNELSFLTRVKAKDGTILVLPGDGLYPTSVLDYNDNTARHLDKTILELREDYHTLNRLEIIKDDKQFVIKNFKPEHHVNMDDQVIKASNTLITPC